MTLSGRHNITQCVCVVLFRLARSLLQAFVEKAERKENKTTLLQRSMGAGSGVLGLMGVMAVAKRLKALTKNMLSAEDLCATVVPNALDTSLGWSLFTDS